MTLTHPLFKDIILEAEYHSAEQPTGEKGFSLGYPGCPASWEVTNVSYENKDVTDFIYGFCDHLFSEFGEDLLEAYPNGLE